MVSDTIDFNREDFVDVDQLDFGEEEETTENSRTTKHSKNQVVPNKSTDTVEKVIDVTSKFLELGKFVFKDVAEALGSIVGVGGLVKAIMKFIPDEPNPVFEKMKVLEGKIDKLSEKMDAKFDDLKAFLVEMKFLVEIVTPSSNLMKLMMDCMKHPSEEGVENFISEYKKNPPLVLAYSVLSLLERKSTNPLKMAMDTDPFKTTTTFNKWYDIINGVLGKFLFLEAFGSGLLEKHSEYNAHRIMGKSDHLFRQIKEWKEEYKKTNPYWSLLPGYVETFLKENSKLNQDIKADLLEQFLSSIITNDAFYLGVFRDWSGDRYLHYTYQVYNKAERYIEVFGHDKTNVFIYKSIDANGAGEETLSDLKKRVKAIEFDVKEFQKDPKNYPHKISLEIKMVVGFVCVIGNLFEVIRGVNCKWNDGNPGWNT